MTDWKTLSTQVVYENPFMRIHEDQCINPAGNQALYGYIESTSDSVFVVPVDKDSNTWLIRQYRYPVKKIMWECTAGSLDTDSVLEGAKRELLEETGLLAKEITPIGDFYLANSFATAKATVCIAQNLAETSNQLDENEGILEVKKLPITEVVQLIMDGTIQDGPSITALFMAKTYLEKNA